MKAYLILPNPHESNPNVAHDAVAYTLGGEWNLVQCHAVHLDGGRVFLLLKVDVAHVHTQHVSLHDNTARQWLIV